MDLIRPFLTAVLRYSFQVVNCNFLRLNEKLEARGLDATLKAEIATYRESAS
jgi:hypothetical protein